MSHSGIACILSAILFWKVSSECVSAFSPMLSLSCACFGYLLVFLLELFQSNMLLYTIVNQYCVRSKSGLQIQRPRLFYRHWNAQRPCLFQWDWIVLDGCTLVGKDTLNNLSETKNLSSCLIYCISGAEKCGLCRQPSLNGTGMG